MYHRFLRYLCPTNYNPADYIMHLSQTETQEALLAKGMFQFGPLTVNPMSGKKWCKHLSKKDSATDISSILSIQSLSNESSLCFMLPLFVITPLFYLERSFPSIFLTYYPCCFLSSFSPLPPPPTHSLF